VPTRNVQSGWKAMWEMRDLGLWPQHTTLCTHCAAAASRMSLTHAYTPRQYTRRAANAALSWIRTPGNEEYRNLASQ
jgi:hypothetical protein